jgi:hypothetical protein
VVSLAIAVYPIVDVTSRGAYAAKICVVVVASNVAGVIIYRTGQKRRGQPSATRLDVK